MMNEWIISSSVLIAAVLAIRFALRGKISLRLQYALWAVVLVRLLLPFQVFISPLSVDAVAEELDIPGAMQQVYLSANEDAYERQYDATYHETVRWHESKGKTFDPAQVEQQAAETARQSLDLSLNLKLFNLWLTGMAAMALVIVACNIHFALRLRRSRRDFPVPDSLLPVYVTAAVPTPCVFGLFRPAIYLTPGAAEDETVLRHALTHELTHYRHLDHVWSVLRSLCLVLHWYNPLVWLAAKVSRADGEMACDEGALRVLGESQRGDYGRTLIGLTCGVRLGSLFLNATTMTGSAGSLRERIRLLMKRPKTTMLTLTALILVVTIIVGCTFSAAPATEQPDITPTPPAETTAPTGHVPDNDMAYDGQELPIPEEPGAAFGSVPYFNELLNPQVERSEADWFPRALTSYYDSPEKIDLFQLFYTGIPGADNTLTHEERTFLESRQTIDPEFVLFRIPAQEMDRVLKAYFDVTLEETEKIGLDGFLYSDKTNCYYHSHTDTNLSFREVTSAEELDGGLWRVIYSVPGAEHGMVTLRRYDGGWRILSNQQLITMPLSDPAEQERMLSLFEDPLVLDGLTYLWGSWEGFSLSGKTKSFVPEILDWQDTTHPNDTVVKANVYYRRPGSSQIYAAQMLRSGGEWELCGNRLVVSMADYADRNPRPLTQEEQEQVNSAFDLFADETRAAACIVNSYYTDATELDVGALLRNFPTAEGATQKEFAALREKYGSDFLFSEFENISDMPVPVHRYRVEDIDAALRRYAGIGHDDLTGRSLEQPLMYLEETDSYYNFTSDFGLLGFHCTGGWVYDGGAVLFSSHSALYLTERGGNYHIQAHLPALMMAMPSSMPMIPAEDSPETAVKDVTEAFLTAYQENVYLYTDNEYDYLTVLAADPDAIAFYGNGQSVPMLDFRNNIQNVHDREAHWKQSRQEQGISRRDFKTVCHFQSITFDGDTATVMAEYAMSFTYDDQPGTTSGGRDEFKLLLVQVDGAWLIAEVTELGA